MKVKQWPLIVIIVLLSVVIGILVYDRLQPKDDTRNDGLYKQIEKELVVLRAENDSLRNLPEPVISPDDTDSLTLEKVNAIIYELRKKQKTVIADTFGSAAIIKYFSELPE